MPEISARSLALVIRAVDQESNRLMNLPDETITPAEEIQLVDYESLAYELEDAYVKLTEGQTNLPEYKRLVTDRGNDLDED